MSRVSAWAHPFVEPSAFNDILERQNAARAEMRTWKKLSRNYAIGFVVFLVIAVLPGPPALLRNVAFGLCILCGVMAWSRWMKVAECRIETMFDPAEFTED
jgi:hypothetical protein